MARKATIYKADIQMSNIDRNLFETLSLTIALHPSETLERMTARLLTFCINATEHLQFTRGLSANEEPDLWEKNLQGDILHWIEIGQPDPARIKSALKRADRVSVYAFGKSVDTWWQKNSTQFESLKSHQIWQFDWSSIEALAGLLERTIAISITITEGLLYINLGESDITIAPERLL